MRIIAAFGTRPEAIKLWPVLRAVEASLGRDRVVRICTGQHQDLLSGLLDELDLQPDLLLPAPPPTSGLPARTTWMQERLGWALSEISSGPRSGPGCIMLVQGDTASSFAAAVAAFHAGIPLVHIEAGLRSFDLSQPFPEEQHRVAITRLAQLHLAPTAVARAHLLAEDVRPDRIVVTGNTGLDAVRAILPRARPPAAFAGLHGGGFVLATVHRREHAGPIASGIGRALGEAAEGSGVPCVVLLHPNQEISAPLGQELRGARLVWTSGPVAYPELIWLLRRAALLVTDSGGLQEEAAFLGCPTLVVRRVTDRSESIDAGCAILAGVEPSRLLAKILSLLADRAELARLARPSNAFGDGHAAPRVVTALCATFGTKRRAVLAPPERRVPAPAP